MNIIHIFVKENVYVEHVFVVNVNVYILNLKQKTMTREIIQPFINKIISHGTLREYFL